MKLRLEHAEFESELIRVMTFSDASQSQLPDYTAGAHIEFNLADSGKRSYSLIDWPEASAGYTIAVQVENQGEGGSKAMHALNVGDIVDATQPQNSFPLIETKNPILLLAGGIGVTPLISMATKLHQQARSFQLHYTARTSVRMGFADILAATFGQSVSLYLDDKNPINLTTLINTQSPSTIVYLCGPRGMIEAARAAALSAGISEQDIHIELFSTPEHQDSDSAFEVEISSTGQVVNVAANQSIIQALESAGLDVMYDCQRGDCGICQCEVISGIPDHRDVVLSDAERASGKVMQICVSRAKSTRLVIEI